MCRSLFVCIWVSFCMYMGLFLYVYVSLFECIWVSFCMYMGLFSHVRYVWRPGATEADWKISSSLVVCHSYTTKRDPYTYQKRPIWIQKETYTCERCLMKRDPYLSKKKTMWWLQLVGSLKLQVSFAEYRLFHRALLHRRPIILRSLLHVATPYMYMY